MNDALNQPHYHLGFLRSEERIPGYELRIFSEGERICVADSPEHAQTVLRALNRAAPRSSGTAPAGLLDHAWKAASKAYNDAPTKKLKAAILAYVAAANEPAPASIPAGALVEAISSMAGGR